MSTENTHRAEAADQPTPLLLVVLAWLIVAVPLAYGLWQTLIKAGAAARRLTPGRALDGPSPGIPAGWHTRRMSTAHLTERRFARMRPVPSRTAAAVEAADLPRGPRLPGIAAEHRPAAVPAPVHPGAAPALRRRLLDPDHARGPAPRRLQPPRARQGDLRGRSRGLPRGQGQRDPRPGDGRALPAAGRLGAAQARPQAADAGVQRARAARLRGPGRRASPRPRSAAGSRASRSSRSSG